MPTALEIKKALKERGARGLPDQGRSRWHLAERVRENLLMDAGIFSRAGGPRVGFVVRAQRTDFPRRGGGAPSSGGGSAAAPSVDRGYLEVDTEVR